MITIRSVQPDEPHVSVLIAVHMSGMIANSPKDSVYALDASELSDPDITLFGAFENGDCLSIGALKNLNNNTGEIKSMRTQKTALGRGIGKLILEHIVQTARKNGMTTLVLETGTGDSFAAAHHIYKTFGFRASGAFGSYEQTDFNRFFSLSL